MFQFTDVFNKNDHSEVPFLSRWAPFMDYSVVSKVDVIELLKGLNPSKALRDFNYRDIDRPDKLNKSLGQSEGQMLIDIMNNHGLKQLPYFLQHVYYWHNVKHTYSTFLTMTNGTNVHLQQINNVERCRMYSVHYCSCNSNKEKVKSKHVTCSYLLIR